MIIIFFLLFILIPASAWAIIPHEYPGVYPHQIGHVFVTASVSVFVYHVIRGGYYKEVGFRQIMISAIFFLFWNVYTFLGHFAELYIRQESFINKESFWGGVFKADLISFCYYIYRFDNLLLVPCLIFFVLGLRVMLKETESQSKK